MIILSILALAAALCGGPGRRSDAQASEVELKAAWIYNFIQHVEWPASAFKDDRAPLVVCVLGAQSIEEPLAKAVRGKTAQGRPVEIRRAAQPSDVRGAHVVFVADAEKERFAQAVEAGRGTPLLVVAESEGFARRGAALNFYADESKVRFEANLEAAARSGLSLSSKLLKFARIVKD